MGCFLSTNRDRSSAYRIQVPRTCCYVADVTLSGILVSQDGQTESPVSVLSWEQADRPDPADFTFKGLQTESKIKTAG